MPTKPHISQILKCLSSLLPTTLRHRQLFDQAHSQKGADQKDLANFLLLWSSKALHDIIVNIWKMESAQQELDSRHTKNGHK